MHSLLSLAFAAALAIVSFDAQAFTDSYSSWAPATGGGPLNYGGAGTLADVSSPNSAAVEGVALPNDLTAGSTLLAFIIHSSVTVSTPPTAVTSGWTMEGTTPTSGTDSSYNMSIWSHPVSSPGSEPAEVEFNVRPGYFFIGIVVEVENLTAVDDVVCGGNSGASPTVQTPNITPGAASGLVFGAMGRKNQAANTFTIIPATEIVAEGATTGNDAVLGVSYATTTGTGSQGSLEWDLTTTSTAVCSIAVH